MSRERRDEIHSGIRKGLSSGCGLFFHCKNQNRGRGGEDRIRLGDKIVAVVGCSPLVIIEGIIGYFDSF